MWCVAASSLSPPRHAWAHARGGGAAVFFWGGSVPQAAFLVGASLGFLGAPELLADGRALDYDEDPLYAARPGWQAPAVTRATPDAAWLTVPLWRGPPRSPWRAIRLLLTPLLVTLPLATPQTDPAACQPWSAPEHGLAARNRTRRRAKAAATWWVASTHPGHPPGLGRVRWSTVLGTAAGAVNRIVARLEAPGAPAMLMTALWQWANLLLQSHTSADVAATVRVALAAADWRRLGLTGAVLQVSVAGQRARAGGWPRAPSLMGPLESDGLCIAACQDMAAHSSAAPSGGSVEAMRLHVHVLHEAVWPSVAQLEPCLPTLLLVMLGLLENAARYARPPRPRPGPSAALTSRSPARGRRTSCTAWRLRRRTASTASTRWPSGCAT